MLKRIFLLLLCSLLLVLAGCAAPAQQDTKTIVTTIFPEYDWVRQILGDDDSFRLVMLCDDGVDPHSFQPTVADMVTVSGCDLLIYGGGESDEWLEDALAEHANPNMAVLELLPMLGDKAYLAEITEGMQAEEEEEETDEHVWLSVRNAAFFCKAIAEELCRLNPAKESTYRENLASYLEKLDALDARYQETVAGGRTDTILVCDRFPLRYLVEDYSLRYYAAFPGCSAESNASFSTVTFLSDRVRDLELDSVLVLEGSDSRIANTVAESSERKNIQILTFHSMQSISGADAQKTDYLTIMEQNRQVLETALK